MELTGGEYATVVSNALRQQQQQQQQQQTKRLTAVPSKGERFVVSEQSKSLHLVPGLQCCEPETHRCHSGTRPLTVPALTTSKCFLRKNSGGLHEYDVSLKNMIRIMNMEYVIQMQPPLHYTAKMSQRESIG